MVRKDHPSREAFGSIGRPAEVLVSSSEETGFLGNERPPSREREAPSGNRWCRSEARGLLERGDVRHRTFGPGGGHPELKGFGSGVVETLLRSSPRRWVLRDSNRSGVREPREGDDFGQSFLGVFRVRGHDSRFAFRVQADPAICCRREPTAGGQWPLALALAFVVRYFAKSWFGSRNLGSL